MFPETALQDDAVWEHLSGSGSSGTKGWCSNFKVIYYGCDRRWILGKRPHCWVLVWAQHLICLSHFGVLRLIWALLNACFFVVVCFFFALKWVGAYGKELGPSKKVQAVRWSSETILQTSGFSDKEILSHLKHKHILKSSSAFYKYIIMISRWSYIFV